MFIEDDLETIPIESKIKIGVKSNSIAMKP